jgi:MBG domain/Bacterial Ig-like domain (group 3)/Transmembrane protein 131-like N-terminal
MSRNVRRFVAIKIVVAACICAIGTVFSTPAGAQLAPAPYFKVVDLGPVGVTGMPNSLNDNRDVAGTAVILRTGANRLTPVFWTNAANMQQLGPADSTSGEAFKVNQAGHVVGYYVKNDGLKRRTAFYYDGSVHELPAVLSDDQTLASDLNDSDVIVGSSYGSPSGGGGYGNGVPVRWHGDQLGQVEQIDQDINPPLVGLPWYSLARSRWANGTKIYINNQGTIAARWVYSGWSNVYPSSYNYAYNYYPDSYPVLYTGIGTGPNPTTNMWSEFNWPGIGDCHPPNNSLALSWDFMAPQAISDEKLNANGSTAGPAKVVGTGNRCTYYINNLGGYVQDNIAFITDANPTDQTYQLVWVDPDGAFGGDLTKTITAHSFSNWVIVPGTPVCQGTPNVRSSYSFFGVKRITDSNGYEQLATVGAHSVAINCTLATGGSTERAVVRYYARDGYDGNTTVELTTRIRQDCNWTLTRATAINSAGEILGKGVKSGISGTAAYRAFLLIPTVPDPATGEYTLPGSKEEGCLDAPPDDEPPGNDTPAATLSPTSLDFGHSPVGVQTVSQPVTVTNTGTASLNISSISTSGDYLESENCTIGPIAPGDSCTIYASFLPTAIGTRTGSLSITDDATDSPQTVSLTGVGDPASTTLVINAPSITYGANGLVTVTVTSPSNTVTGNVSLTIDGGAPIAQTLSGGSGVFTLTGLNAGDHSLSASFAAQGNFGASSNTGTLHVDKATATINVTAYNLTYDGNPHTASGTATGVSGADLSAQLTLTATTHTNAGTYNGDAWSFAGGTNYNDASGTVNDNISKATATVTLSNLTQVYTGGSLTPTATTNPPGLTIVWTNAPQTDLGTYTVTATVNDPNYQGSASGPFLIEYGVPGFFAPYAPPTAGRAYTVGSSIPLKWQFTNASGTPLSSPNAAPDIQIYAMGACGGTDTLVMTVNDPGNSGYQYDPSTDIWQFNWKTTGLPAGCYDIYIHSGQSGQTTGGFPIQLGK